MEEILRRLQKEASGHKHKAIRDACVYACGECCRGNKRKTSRHDRREIRFLLNLEDLFKGRDCCISGRAAPAGSASGIRMLRLRFLISFHEEFPGLRAAPERTTKCVEQ